MTNEEPKAGQSSPGELQFDQAEYAAPAASTACSACNQVIEGSYYEANGNVLCSSCRDQLETALTGGSRLRRFFRAAIFGLIAAALGAGIYYGISALTGYEFGLVAILVGLMVGGAVKSGSDGRGGWFYQGLAMFLTYSAIVATYVPQVVKGIAEMNAETRQEIAALDKARPAKDASDKTDESKPAKTADEVVANRKAVPPVLGMILAIVAVTIIAYIAPFFGGFMGLIIVGIGLYEAWHMNRRVRISITGPYQVAAAGTGSPQPQDGPDHA